MKILAPVNNFTYVNRFKNLGADEFYAGFKDDAWAKIFGEGSYINCRSTDSNADKYFFEPFVKKIAKHKDKDFYVTFNANDYTNEQRLKIAEYAKELAKAGLKGCIISQPGLIDIIKKEGLKCVISTEAGIYNAKTAQFYADRGADRIVLPRDVSLKDVELIKNKVSDIEYEVFILNTGCVLSDPFCIGHHSEKMETLCTCVCYNDIQPFIRDQFYEMKVFQNQQKYEDFVLSHCHDACGACALYKLLHLGIDSVKIVGRTNDPEKTCKDIDFIKKNILTAKKATSEKEYLETMLYPENKLAYCKNRYACYFPDFHEII